MNKYLIAAILFALVILFIKKQENNVNAPVVVTTPMENLAAEIPAQPVTAQSSRDFACDGRTYCSQMKSCDEAKYFIQHCPNTKMDGDHDGIPCESQWCN